MTKKFMFICQNCGAVHRKWNGQCSECGEWNSMVEEAEEGDASTLQNSRMQKFLFKSNAVVFENLDREVSDSLRVDTGINELNRVLGGGVVRGSAVLIGGDPGIGKSTLLLQAICSIADRGLTALYVSGEESTNQIKMRAQRLQLEKSQVKVTSASSIGDIVNALLTQQPEIVVIDSIQTVFSSELSSAAGTVSQVRFCGNELVSLAKARNMILFIVSHVNKDGQIAGPKVLEHMVDTVLYFEGDRDYKFRILRSIKNRFGAANEIGIFEMHSTGLCEIMNPSQLFLSTREDPVSGSVVFAGMEGSRPLLAEIQALIAPSYMPSPRRAVVGWDQNRLAMIIAVVASRFGVNLYDREVYLNVVGGLKIDEPAADLAVAAALISAYRDIPVARDSIFMGEVGLSGEIRMVSQIDYRLREAEKLGFQRAIVPGDIDKSKTFKREHYKLGIMPMKHLRDLGVLFRKF
ncbi:MAG: DNA repair protein RadA [Rickettsiales bacterium]|jgi:DNA repair protein RadA/Sms|nr:DNA repair protein RadA [Rickettsiales bacterium]